ncbi:MAG: class I SAM-dependent RNA methyltransferase [bacterium]|nr:class I SAM-dependent RNA methyltransferase [bacterium]
MEQMKTGTVEKIANGGWGLVRSEEGVVFLNYVLPGETVSYRIKEKAKGILWGELLEVITPSPHRTEPPCPYYGQCGGCVFQHIQYPQQETIKKDILLNDLKRIGHFEGSLDNYRYYSSPPYDYRVRARMKARDNGKIGFIRKGTNTVIDINKCLLFPPKINAFLEKWNTLETPPFFFQQDIFLNPDNDTLHIHLSHPPKDKKTLLKTFPEVVFSWKGNEHSAVSKMQIKDASYFVSPTVFFQVNRYQWDNMLNCVEAYLHPCDTIIDLYSGVGFFIPLMAKYAGKSFGIESYGFSVNLAQRAFPQENVKLINVAAEKFKFFDADILVVDPPRSGVSKTVMTNILKQNYPRLIYISCSSATFARDLEILLQNGYKLEDFNMFDLFPQTGHIETIALFTCGG